MTFATFVNQAVGAISSIVIPLLFGAAFLAFLWGVVNYFFLHGGEEEKRAEGRSFVIWGLFGMVVMFSVWGLVNLLLSTFGIAPPAA